MTAMTYSVRTWDTDLQAYTPQEGMKLPWNGLSLQGLRGALKELRAMGYSCHRLRDSAGGHESNDPAVLVEREDCLTDGKR